MPLKIRLARAGSKKRPYYHVVIADARSPRDGRFIESIGSWNPLLPKDGERVKVDADRVKHWLSHGAQPTDRVLRFLDEAGLAQARSPLQPEEGRAGQEGAGTRLSAEEGAGRRCRRRCRSCRSPGRGGSRHRRISSASSHRQNGGPVPAVLLLCGNAMVAFG